ncbi:hypothetical protein YC2023_092963 [Brassica napus]
MNRRTNPDQNRFDHSTSDQRNWPTVEQVQPQLPPPLLTYFQQPQQPLPLLTSFQPLWFVCTKVLDFSDIPHLRRLALMSDLSSRIVSQIEYYFRAMTDDIHLILRSMGSSTTVEVQVFELRKRHGWKRWILP